MRRLRPRKKRGPEVRGFGPSVDECMSWYGNRCSPASDCRTSPDVFEAAAACRSGGDGGRARDRPAGRLPPLPDAVRDLPRLRSRSRVLRAGLRRPRPPPEPPPSAPAAPKESRGPAGPPRPGEPPLESGGSPCGRGFPHLPSPLPAPRPKRGKRTMARRSSYELTPTVSYPRGQACGLKSLGTES